MPSESLKSLSAPSPDSVHEKFVERLARIYITKKKKSPDEAAVWANRIIPFALVGRVKAAIKRLGLR